MFGNQIIYNFKDLIFDFEQLINLSKNELIEIGSHTLTHAKLTTLNNSEIYNELKNSKEIIEKKIGKKVNFLAYPYGSQNEVNDNIIQIAKQVGYEMAFSPKVLLNKKIFFDIPRYNIDNYIDQKTHIKNKRI